MKSLLCALVLALSSCGVFFEENGPAKDAKERTFERHCTDSQLEQVKNFYKVCKGTDYFKSYCFDRGILMYCDKIDSLAKKATAK